MVSAPVYATRGMVTDALDTKSSAYQSGRVDRALDSASRRVEGLLHRTFYPLTATKSFEWPGTQDETSRLWLDQNELYSVFSFTSGGATVPASGYYLEPQQYGPPYDRIEINRGGNYAFSSNAAGPQRSLVISGIWMGCDLVEESAGTIGAISSSATSFTLTPSPTVPMILDAGSILRVDSERMLVTDRAWSTSGQTGTLTSSMADQSLAVADGSVFVPKETILLDAEMLLIQAVSGNTLIVKRAVQGSTLAAHTAAAISWSRTFVVSRGALGTTAAAHSASASALRFIVPGLVEQLTIAYALDRGLQEITGYSRTGGEGDSQYPESGRGIRTLEKAVRAEHGRRARFRSV